MMGQAVGDGIETAAPRENEPNHDRPSLQRTRLDAPAEGAGRSTAFPRQSTGF
jgi:hypothetical protein